VIVIEDKSNCSASNPGSCLESSEPVAATQRQARPDDRRDPWTDLAPNRGRMPARARLLLAQMVDLLNP
jgi:hypothetical protein